MKNVTPNIKNLVDGISNKFRFIKKYNYNIDEIIGVKGKERYILYIKRKLIRIYRNKLKAAPLLSTYIPIDNAIFYSFKVERTVVEKVDLDSFVETKVYDEAGIDETEEYIIKYKVIDNLTDSKYVNVETIIVPVTFLNEYYKDILNETGYIDYIAFPAFSYKALYEEKILKKANDVFVVILFDKIFLTFYSEGELIYIQTLSGGIDKIYESLSSLKIKNFSFDLFKKLLTKKGLAEAKYTSNELIVLEVIKKEMTNIVKLVKEQINNYQSLHETENIDRVFVTSEYGDIPDLDLFFGRNIQLDSFNFEFYEKYNLDRLPVDPFLFLAMLEAHYAYKHNNQEYNFSIFLRKPTFFYRPSGKLTLTFIASLIVIGAYPFYLWLSGLSYENQNKKLSNEISKLQSKIAVLSKKVSDLTRKEKFLKTEISKNKKEVSSFQKFIESVYKFKFSYLPKSQEIADITYLLNKNHVYAKNISYKKGLYEIRLFAYKENNIPSLIKELSDNGFGVDFDKIVYSNGRYNSIIRIKE